ncbi:MAG: hypothetical protein ACREXV_02155 [Polaromonas sp.]
MDYNDSTVGVWLRNLCITQREGVRRRSGWAARRDLQPIAQLLAKIATPQTAITTMPMTDQRSGACENTSQPASAA